MTTDELLTAFSTAGFDTPQKVTALLSMASAQMQRNATLIQIDALKAKQSAAVQAIEAERQQLESKVTELTAQITAPRVS